MRKVNEREKKKIFSEEDIQNGRWSIDATYPEVNLGSDLKGAAFKEYPHYEVALHQNPEFGELLGKLEIQGLTKGPLFFQPYLEKPLEQGEKIPKEVLIVALADLGVAGLAEKEVFFQEGDDEMRELYGNLRKPEVIHRLLEGETEADLGDRQKVATTFLDWLKNQPGFAVWQALRFEKILFLLKQRENIASVEEQGLRALFSHFEGNIKATFWRAKEYESRFKKTQAEQGEKAAFRELARDLHYEI